MLLQCSVPGVEHQSFIAPMWQHLPPPASGCDRSHLLQRLQACAPAPLAAAAPQSRPRSRFQQLQACAHMLQEAGVAIHPLWRNNCRCEASTFSILSHG